MKSIKITFISLGVFLIITCISSAQDSAQVACTPDDIKLSVTNTQQALQQIETALSTGDIQASLELLKDIENEARSIQSKCKGWNFAGVGTDALGPLELEPGVYILEYKADIASGPIVMGTLGINFENLDAEELIFDSVLEVFQKVGEQTGRKIVRLEGGRYLISLDAGNLNGWSLSLSKP